MTNKDLWIFLLGMCVQIKCQHPQISMELLMKTCSAESSAFIMWFQIVTKVHRLCKCLLAEHKHEEKLTFFTSEYSLKINILNEMILKMTIWMKFWIIKGWTVDSDSSSDSDRETQWFPALTTHNNKVISHSAFVPIALDVNERVHPPPTTPLPSFAHRFSLYLSRNDRHTHTHSEYPYTNFVCLFVFVVVLF